ncbi:His-Xaa-Ser system radical SAM maturase HxsC [Lysobacter terrae]
MLALDSKVQLTGWGGPALLKVAGLAEFARGEFPIERMILDLRDSQIGLESEQLLSLPWAGFLAGPTGSLPTGRPAVTLLETPEIVRPGDVIELRPTQSKLAVRYRRGDNGNVLFATERCNSFCLMCSQPPRQIEDDWRVEQLCALVDLIDKDEPSVAISGGEPTLLKAGLPRIIERCAKALPRTHVHVLSNGRLFGEGAYAQSFAGLHPSLTWGIPLYGDHYQLHDYVVQSPGAFAQTMRGLYALQAAGQRIEVRVVLVRPTVSRLQELVRYLYRNLPFVEHVALMGIEPIGFAKANHDALWIDPADMAEVLSETVEYLTQRGMPISLYNLPLCTLPSSLWPFARRSISNWKQDYLAECEACDVRSQCGGFFGWVTPEWTSRTIGPIRRGS